MKRLQNCQTVFATEQELKMDELPIPIFTTDSSISVQVSSESVITAPAPPIRYEYFGKRLPNFDFFENEIRYCDEIRELLLTIDEELGISEEESEQTSKTNAWCMSLEKKEVVDIYYKAKGTLPNLVKSSTIKKAETLAIKVNRVNSNNMHSVKHMIPVFKYLVDILEECAESHLQIPPKSAFYSLLAFEMANLHVFMSDWTFVQTSTGDIVNSFGDFMEVLVAYILLNTLTDGWSDLELQSFELALDLSYGCSNPLQSGKHYHRLEAFILTRSGQEPSIASAATEQTISTSAVMSEKEVPRIDPISTTEITSFADVQEVYKLLLSEHGRVLVGRKK